MKKQLLGFFLILSLYPCAFAADGGGVHRVIPGVTTNSDAKTISEMVSTRGGTENAATSARTAVTRTSAPKASATPAVAVRSGARVVNTTEEPKSTDKETLAPRASNVVSRGVGRSGGVVSEQTARDKVEAAANVVGRNARVTAAGLNANPAVRRAGLTLRPTVAEVGGRATIAGTDIQTGSNIDESLRAISARAATTTAAARESIAEAKERLEQTADLNKSCQQQYNECMDQFCSVIDANQKRCSCSSNLSQYTKIEQAVKDANTQLNEVAQRIRYVGLSADEIRAIMNATEAELELTGAADTTETRHMLDEIEDLIKDPSKTTSYSSDTFSGLDMDLSFSGELADVFSLDFLNTGTTSVSNMRGVDLYNSAKKRCSTILSQCKEVGATQQQITGNYDLAIDKDCIAYEQGLVKMNENLLSNVRSANLMLQKARLAVLQNKNQYDAKGCIGALDACMTDDMVCGDDYSKCVDPTKVYIDENGKVVLGQKITDIPAFMTDYNNAEIDKNFLMAASSQKLTVSECKKSAASDKTGGNDGSCVAKYLLQKIGTGQKVTDGGLCRAVLDKCQMYSYDSNGNYQPYNDVVINYIQRALINIRAAQQKIISDYSSSCMLDIASCYNQQVTQVNAWTTSADVGSIYRVMRGACRNVALTCAYAVFTNDTSDNGCPTSGTDATDKCIDNISAMFYQSLLCPDNSTYTASAGTPNSNNYVNSNCVCVSGYEPYGGSCVTVCPTGTKRNTYGICE